MKNREMRITKVWDLKRIIGAKVDVEITRIFTI
jgi:hypothetical protein